MTSSIRRKENAFEILRACSLELYKTTYIVLKLGKHGENRNMEKRMVSTRRGNNYCQLLARKEVKKGCYCRH